MASPSASDRTSAAPSRQILTNLVPKSAWGRKYKPTCPSELWDALFQFHSKEAANACEYCHWSPVTSNSGRIIRGNRLVLHQEWKVTTDHETKPTNGTFAFERFEVICWRCHDVKHAGWANFEGRPAHAHMASLNGWDAETTENQLDEAFYTWTQHYALKSWTYNLDNWDNHPVFKEYKEKHGTEGIKFGSLCLLRSGNLNQQPKARKPRASQN